MKNLVESNKESIKKVLNAVGYDFRHWTRPVMYESCKKLIDQLNPNELDVLEISAGQYFREMFSYKNYTEANYPEFDICKDRLDQRYDLIIADQVFEHLLWPYRAAVNVYEMLKPGGHFLVTTPFLIRIHAVPTDCTRWTETGIKYFLSEAGFALDSIHTDSWGNRACVKANFNKWARKGWFSSLKNETDFPVVVWALAKK